MLSQFRLRIFGLFIDKSMKNDMRNVKALEYGTSFLYEQVILRQNQANFIFVLQV